MECNYFFDSEGVYQGPEVLSAHLVPPKNSLVKSLGCLVMVEGDIALDNCLELKSLGNLVKVKYNASFKGCSNLSSLGNLDTVEGSLDLRGTAITSLGKLKAVGAVGSGRGLLGDLSLQELRITDYGSLARVRGKLSITKSCFPPPPTIIFWRLSENNRAMDCETYLDCYAKTMCMPLTELPKLLSGTNFAKALIARHRLSGKHT